MKTKKIKEVKGTPVEIPALKKAVKPIPESCPPTENCCSRGKGFEVVNYKGGVVACFATKELAQVYATKYGYKVK